MQRGLHHTGQAFNAYNKIIIKIEKNLNNKIISIFKFNKTIIVDRLIQVIVDLSRNTYIELCKKRIDDNLEMIPDEIEQLKLKNIIINSLTGNVQITNKLIIKSLSIYVYFWLKLFLFNLCSLIVFEKDSKKAVLFYGLGSKAIIYKDSDQRFIEFCKYGPIRPLNNFEKLIMQEFSFTGSLSDRTVLYRRYPIEELLCHSNLSISQRIELLIKQIQFLIIYLYVIVRNPIILLLAKDVVYLPLFILLDKYNYIDSVIITNSSFYFQPLWIRGPNTKKYKVHNIHYSQNDKPVTYIFDKLDVNSPAVSKIYSDVHWVWTSGRKEEVIKRGHNGEVNVVGPILGYLQDNVNIKKDDEIIKIAIFDILPVKPNYRAAIGVIRNPYITENMILFIKNIVSVIDSIHKEENIKIDLYIKHKRSHSHIHDEIYLEYIRELINNGTLKLIPDDENLYTLLSQCALAINAAYTSVAYICNHLKREAVYYDPAHELLPTYEPSNYITFINNKQALLEYVRNKLLIKS